MMTKTERDELRKKWETRIADFKKSGQTAAQYCKDNGLKPAQLGYWLRKFRTENNTSQTLPNFVSVEINDTAKEITNTIQIKVGKATVEVRPGFNSKLLSDVVKTLTNLC